MQSLTSNVLPHELLVNVIGYVLDIPTIDEAPKSQKDELKKTAKSLVTTCKDFRSYILTEKRSEVVYLCPIVSVKTDITTESDHRAFIQEKSRRLENGMLHGKQVRKERHFHAGSRIPYFEEKTAQKYEKMMLKSRTTYTKDCTGTVHKYYDQQADLNLTLREVRDEDTTIRSIKVVILDPYRAGYRWLTMTISKESKYGPEYECEDDMRLFQDEFDNLERLLKQLFKEKELSFNALKKVIVPAVIAVRDKGAY